MAVEIADIAIDAGDHVVQFYKDESELAQTAGKYLSDGARTAAVAVVIATAGHRRVFEAELNAAGIDPEQACRERTLVFLDAATTLAAFMPDGRIDGAAFRDVVGSVVRRAGETGRPVRAYGEMVALLWEAGNVLAAIELEELWNDLSRELDFSLLCAYPSHSVGASGQAESLQHVCRLHSSVLGSPPSADPGARHSASNEVSADFLPGRDAPGSARHFVADTLARWGHAGAVVQDAQLLVTELATNAVVHARSPFSVVARAGESRVRVSVRDTSPLRPTLRDGDPAAMSGRGLRLVAVLCADWGVEMTADGKTVWGDLQTW